MKRLYLSQDGTVRSPGPGEHGHLDMGRTILGPDWRGDMEHTYMTMWNAGWVRVVDSPDTLVGEQWRDGKPVAFADLPPVQQEWLEANSVRAGKQLCWNAKVFESTREGQSNAAQAAQVRTPGQTLSDMQRIYLSEDGVARMLTGDERDHTDMARTILGDAAKDATMDFDLHCLMWNSGWVRVVSTPEKLYGEKLLSRRQAPFESGTRAQRDWLEDNSKLLGKQLIWNDAVFARTREGQPEAPPAQP